MAYLWSSAFALLVLAQLKGHGVDGEVSSCAEVHTATPLVTFGSAVSASCLITEDCPLAKDAEFDVRWHDNNESIQGSTTVNTSRRASQIFISNFSEPSRLLTCYICQGLCKVVAGLEIRAGFLPSSPQNLSCQTNLTKPEKLHCSWTPGSDTLIPTNYSFHMERLQMWKVNYSIPPGVNHISIPRTEFHLFSEMQVFVKVQNALGQATTQPLTFTPMENAKLDMPTIQSVKPERGRNGCLTNTWSLSADQNWMMKTKLEIELRLKPVDVTLADEEKVLVRFVRDKAAVERCNLLHGTEYQAQMRVRYRQMSPWSEWSNQARGFTLEKAPTGPLDTWLKVTKGQHYNTVELVWKPSKQFRANSKNVFYVVYVKKAKKARGINCTRGSHCIFKISKAVKKVYLKAKNAVGESRPTEIPVYSEAVLEPVSSLSVLPDGDSALLVHWGSPLHSSPTGYVLECRQQHDNNSSFISFHLLDRNQSSALVADGIEPYIPYEISVYPKYEKGVGRRQGVLAYSKQKAPSIAPELNFPDIWDSHSKLSWSEIPMSKRNGIILGYRVYYEDEDGNTEVKYTNETSIVLRDLKPQTRYRALIMVSTSGGSLNGSVVNLQTRSVDVLRIILIGIPTCVGITLVFIIILLTTLTNHKWLKRFLWPKIPDPANSSIRKWSTTELLQDSPPQKDSMEHGLVFLTHFSVVDLTEKEMDKLVQTNKDRWLRHEMDSDLYSHSSSQPPSSPFGSDGTGEHVPYATLVFSGPYQSQPPPPAYLRSESTQPLLEEEEPPSPSPFGCVRHYENVVVRGKDEEHIFSECEDTVGVDRKRDQRWEDFPLLNSLAVKEV
ncbi:granulocyte colony-stimulating factor receptor [Sardina pilchardus]|uniref:granulocyte colony-stimulating factor receptor n=1 Tax=Sardina pilchardus TaxID=27697 RepID=UPI002E161D2E